MCMDYCHQCGLAIDTDSEPECYYETLDNGDVIEIGHALCFVCRGGQ